MTKSTTASKASKSRDADQAKLDWYRAFHLYNAAEGVRVGDLGRVHFALGHFYLVGASARRPKIELLPRALEEFRLGAELGHEECQEAHDWWYGSGFMKTIRPSALLFEKISADEEGRWSLEDVRAWVAEGEKSDVTIEQRAYRHGVLAASLLTAYHGHHETQEGLEHLAQAANLGSTWAIGVADRLELSLALTLVEASAKLEMFDGTTQIRVEEWMGDDEREAPQEPSPKPKPTGRAPGGRREARRTSELPRPDLRADAAQNRLDALFQARVSKDLAQLVEEFRAATGMTKKEIAEQALRMFLEANREPD